MAESTFRAKNLLIPTVSLLALSACGGSGSTLNYADAGTFTGPGDTELDVNKQHTQPVGVFLVNEADGIDVSLSKVGQQDSPAAAIVDIDGNRRITASDAVRYNQVAFMSAACIPSDWCPNGEAIKALYEQQRKGYEDEIKQLQDELKTQQAAKKDTSAIRTKITALQGKIASLTGAENKYVYIDVDNTWLQPTGYTIDEDNNRGKKLINDAGITKIDGKRIKGKIYQDGGTIDRRFNGIDSLESEGRARVVYYRDPASAGWSYQTFLRYYSAPNKNLLNKYRDLLQGYQSIGLPTQDMPEQGWAQYSGISHALYDGNQVTMLNNIRADFGKRSLSYNTSGAAVLHTFEKAGHIIEDRPDLNITGNASWAKGKHDFIGTAVAGNGLRGRLEGRFYGPNAAEVGGVFGMKGVVNGETVQYIGGFGAKR